jgi:ribulose-bisphosphate carboxylase large chain
MQAIEAWQEGITLEEKAKKAPELKSALEKWGHYKPK